ncbi:MAG: hypothetical protein N3D85_07825 [Candidatus Bathyarchaeota archaeon]|nr:hypothetical protein [Candidatus Bathyarchaeota archaeon]
MMTQTQKKRIPEGLLVADIPLESCKAYPMQIFKDTPVKPRVAYSDHRNGETTNLCIKLLPNGAKTAPHPQLCFFIKGNYHIEELSYCQSNVWNWRTWIEFVANAYEIDHIINSLAKTKKIMVNKNA